MNEPIKFSDTLTFQPGTKFFFMDSYDHLNVQDAFKFDPERKDVSLAFVFLNWKNLESNFVRSTSGLPLVVACITALEDTLLLWR